MNANTTDNTIQGKGTKQQKSNIPSLNAASEKNQDQKNKNFFSSALVRDMDSALQTITQPGVKEHVEAQLEDLVTEQDVQRFNLKCDKLKASTDGAVILFYYITDGTPQILNEHMTLSSATQEEKKCLSVWLSRFWILRKRFKNYQLTIQSRKDPWYDNAVCYSFNPNTERALIDLKLNSEEDEIFHTVDYPEKLLLLTLTLLESIKTALTLFSGADSFALSETGRKCYRNMLSDIGSIVESIKRNIG